MTHPSHELAPGLYLVATPIGNLGDVTLRALDVLRGADLVLAEDTRVTAKLLNGHGIRVAELSSYHEHNAESARPRILERLGDGARVALVSDAGTPLVSDPGYKLVEAALAEGHAVVPVPGASAVMAALTVSGLPTDRFFFAGFLPTKPGARRSAIAELANVPATLVLFESARRLPTALSDLAAVLGDRPAAVARELTKKFEEVKRGPLSELAADYAVGPPKGEIVLVIGPPVPQDLAPGDAELDALLTEALARLSVKDAAAEVAAATGLKRRDLYQRALVLSRRDPGTT